MSKISIACIKYDKKEEESYNEKEKYHKDKSKEKSDKKGIELNIEASQLFMNTEKFFNCVKESITQYFDSIEQK